MLIKFDHISYSCSIDEKKDVCTQFAGQYEVLFEETNLKNILCKQKLFYRNHEYHDLIMLHSEECLPVEITAYDSCETEMQGLLLEDNKIIIRTAKIGETETFFKELGFVQQEDFMVLRPVMDKQEIVLQMIESKEKYNLKLDNHGFSSLAFWSNNIGKEKERLQKSGYEVTDVEEFTVNQKRLKICFVVGKQGEIVELIGVK